MRNKLYFIPNIFTLLNLFFGFFAIIKIFSEEYHLAAWFILFAVIFDAWDGAVARMTNSESKFGFEFDSLADLVSSGLAPCLLVYTSVLSDYGAGGVLVCFCYIATGCYRLSRFNVLNTQKKCNEYTGLPLPVSAVTIAALWIFNFPFVTIDTSGWWIYVLLFLSIIMISTVPYNWPAISFKKGYKTGIISITLLFLILIMILFPKKYLFPLVMMYILYGVIMWLVRLIDKKMKRR